jgi:hypothetical protein
LAAKPLLELAHLGHSAEITAAIGGWSLVVRADGQQAPAIEMNGAPEEGLPGNAIDDMERAITRGDALAALELARDAPGAVSVVLRNNPSLSGAHWVLSSKDLGRLLSGPTWPATTRQLAAEPRRVMLDDLGARCLTTREAVFLGPEGQCDSPSPIESDRAYLQARVAEGRARLSSPYVFAPLTSTPDTQQQGDRQDLVELRRCLSGTTRNLVWYWLASDVEIRASGELLATFSGARVVTVELRPEGVDNVGSEIALYEWASGGAGPAQREALQQAVSLALVTPADLPTAARPALRTARLLYDLSQRGAIAEALAARRTARAAAAESARSTAQAARGAAGKALERALIQVGAGVGIVLSNTGDLIGRVPALVLLGLVAAVAATSLLVFLRVELPSATDGLTSELADLRQYRDTLSDEELTDIASSSAVRSARSDLYRTKRTVVALYVAVLVTVVFLGGPFLLAQGGDQPAKKEPPQPSPIVSVVSSPASTSSP